MPEIVWKQDAENDLLQIFADLEVRSEEQARDLFTNWISLSSICGTIRRWRQCLKNLCGALSSVQLDTACFIRLNRAASLFTR